MTLKEQIINLRLEGKTYKQIEESIGCSSSLVSYHLGNNQKESYRLRRVAYLSKQHPYYHKCIAFGRHKVPDLTLSHLQSKIHEFSKNGRKSGIMQFTPKDVIDKFGETPKCYLTGEPIDISKPDTYSFDHILPRSRGGDNSLDNLGIATKQANMAKSDLTPEELFALCQQILIHQGYSVVAPNESS